MARLGDVTVGLNEWLGGPSAPSRIEGLAIHWPNKPADLSLKYDVEIGGRQRQARSARDGKFAGTKGRALPIVGLTLALEGDDEPTHEMLVEATFLGAAPIKRRGSSISLRGPSGREPLVGLKLAFELMGSFGVQRRQDTVTGPGRVRVFRGESQRDGRQAV